MKFHYKKLLPLAFALLGAATLYAQDENATLNNVENYITYGGSTITIVDDTDAVEGDAFRIQHTGELVPGAAFSSAVQISPSAGNLDRAGLTHTISLRYRADDPRDIIFWVTSREEGDPTFTDDQFQVGGANASYYVLSATTDWQAFSVTLTSPQEEGAPDHYVHLQFPTANDTIPFLVDDIDVVTEGSDSTGCQEGPLNVSSNYSSFFGTASATTVDDSTANCGDAVAFTLAAEPAGNFDEGLSFRDDLSLEDTPGNRYRITLRYRADAEDQAALYVPSRKRAGGDITAYFAELNLTTEWQTLEAEFESPRTPGEVDQFIYVGFGIGGLETTMYIDAFFLEQTNETCDPGLYNVPESYTLFNGNNGTIEQVDDETGGCGTALKVCNTGEATPDNNFSQGIQITDERRLRDLAGKRFRLTFRARKDGTTPLSTGAYVSTRAEGAAEIQAAFISTTITEEWQTFSQEFDSPLEAGQSNRFLHWSLGIGATNDCIYLDDVVFEDITPVRTENVAFYVDPNGSDGNDGLLETRAFRTLTFGLSKLIPGDSLIVGDGEYTGQFRVTDLIGTAEAPTVVISKNPYGAKLVGNDQNGTIFQVLNSDFVVVSGFEAYHPGEGEDDWMTAFEAFGSDYVTFSDNYAHDCGCAGFGGRLGDYLTYERNVARDNAKNNPFNCSGLSIYQPLERDQAPGPHIIIRDNVLLENECRIPFAPRGFTVPTDGNGIILDDFEQTQTFDGTANTNPPFLANTLIENNIVFNNGGAGIKTFETANVTIRNNTVYHNNLVLSEFGSSVGDIDLQAVTGPISVYNNIAVKKFSQPGHAISFAPKDDHLDDARLLATSNMIVGTFRQIGPDGIRNVSSNLIASEDRQSYPAFANAAAVDEEVPAFATIEEFTGYFGLRENSAAIDAGTEPTLPNGLDASVEDDLTGRERTGGIDLGALEGPYEGVGDLPPDPTLLAIVNSTPSPMSLDGAEDGFYTSPLQQLTKIIAGDNPADDDLGATWKGGYDTENLYVYVEVTDDSVTGGDRVLILLDGGNEKSDTTDDNDALFTIAADGTSEQVEGAATTTSTGYAVEVAIPWSEISFTPADSSVFGIEIVVEDSDGDEGVIENRLAWQSTVEGIEDNPSLYGEAELREVAPPPAILKATAPVELDGELDDAYAEAEAFAIDTEIQPTITGTDDLSATWRSVYDADGLYFYVEVQDDALRSDNADGEWFQDDGVEIYLDADNSKTFNSYDENDYQVVVRLDGSIFDTKGQLGDGAEASITETDSGYIAEVKLPWTAIGATPAPGLFLGLDVHVIDDDDGGNRDGKLSWFAEIDQSFSNAALFGTVYLAEEAEASNQLPGKIEAETYLEQPDITVVPSDDDDTDVVVFSQRGDYLEYEVSVQEAGMYRFTYRVARESKGLVVFSLIQGDEALHYGKLLRWTPANEWDEVEAYAYLEEGIQTLRIQSEGRQWKLNWFAAEVVDMSLPGQIEAEAFRERGNRVVVLPSGDTDETQAISFLTKDAYVTYPVNITEAGRYTFTYRVRTVSKKMEFSLQLNDETIHQVKAKRLKDSPFGWQEVSATADLPAGEHVLRILSKKRGGSINWWRAESEVDLNARNAGFLTKEESLNRAGSLNRESQLFSIYPNPSRGSVLLSLPEVEDARVEVYDFQGRSVLRRAVDRPSMELGLQDLPNGLYLIRVKTAEYDEQQRIILEK